MTMNQVIKQMVENLKLKIFVSYLHLNPASFWKEGDHMKDKRLRFVLKYSLRIVLSLVRLRTTDKSLYT